MSNYDVNDVIDGLKTWSNGKLSFILNANDLQEVQARYETSLDVIDGLKKLGSPVPEEVIQNRDQLAKKIALSQKEKENLLKFSDELIVLANNIREHFPSMRKKHAYKTGTRIMYQSPFSCIDRKTLPTSLADILEVCLEIYVAGKTYNSAVKVVSERNGVDLSTISDKCTRFIGLNTKKFKKLVENKENLMEYLKQRFPKNKQQIKECLVR